MRIQHNIMAMNAYRNYNTNTSALSKNLEKLSSGYKINRAGDDAAGLAISEKMRAQITGLDQAQDNAQSGINLVQTAEGALQEVHDMLNRMVKLADQSANGTYDDAVDRDNLQKEVDQLTSEIDRIADSANYNGIQLLDGSMDTTAAFDVSSAATSSKAGLDVIISADNAAVKSVTFAKASSGDVVTVTKTGAVTIKLDTTKNYSASDIQALLKKATGASASVTQDVLDAVHGATVAGKGATGVAGANSFVTATTSLTAATGKSLTLQIGDTSDDFNQLSVSIEDMHADALGLGNISIASQSDAKNAVDVIKNAINLVSSMRGTLGATQNRLDHTINNLSVMQENIQDAESTIRDTDVADEMMAYTKNNILVQSAQAMLAQANQVPQGVLQLLQ